MTVFVAVVAIVLLVVSIIAQFVVMAYLVRAGDTVFEQYLRVMAFTSGILGVLVVKDSAERIARVWACGRDFAGGPEWAGAVSAGGGTPR